MVAVPKSEPISVESIRAIYLLCLIAGAKYRCCCEHLTGVRDFNTKSDIYVYMEPIPIS